MASEHTDPLQYRRNRNSECFFSHNECPSWIAETDIVILLLNKSEKRLLVSPGDDVEISFRVGKDNLPPAQIGTNIIEVIKVSTRSCIAQSGVFFQLDQRELTIDEIELLEAGEDITLTGKIHNYSVNPMEFRTGDSIASLYYTNNKDLIVGDELIKLVAGGLIQGIEGDDFVFLSDGGETNALALRVSDKRIYCQRNEGNRPLRVTSRKELYSITRQVDEETENVYKNSLFYLLETKAEVKLPECVMGELSSVTELQDVVHLPSHLIHPGSNWVVRLEVNGGHPSWVLMRFYQNKKLEVNIRGKRATFDASLVKSQFDK